MDLRWSPVLNRMSSAEEYIMRADDLIIESETLGVGGYGTVHKAKHIRIGNVAVKRFSDSKQLPKRLKNALMKEFKRLKQAEGHENVLKVHGILLENDCCLVLEYMLFGSVAHFLEDYHVDVALRMRMTSQVLSAMAYLHGLKPPFLHLDIKADNILVDKYMNAKVSDFGLAEWKTLTMTVTQMVPDQGRACTITHIAPEVLEDVNIASNTKQDVYAFAVTLWEIFSGGKPYNGKQNSLVREAVLVGQRPIMTKLCPDCPDFIKTMISQCWDHNPDARPLFAELCKEMDKEFPKYREKILVALQSIRQQICSIHAVNDDQYLDTSYLDEEPMGEGPTTSNIAAVAASSVAANSTATGAAHSDLNDDDNDETGSLAATKVPSTAVSTPSPDVDLCPPALDVYGEQPSIAQHVFPRLSNPLKPNRRITPNFQRIENLPAPDKQIRQVLQSAPALELVNSFFDESLVCSDVEKELLKDQDRLREYIEKDTDLRRDIMQGNGRFFSCLNSPTYHETVHRGRLAEQHKSTMITSVIDQEERDKFRTQRHSTMRNSKYEEKLQRNRLGQKLTMALRDPPILKDILSKEKQEGSGEKFQLLDKEVVNAAKDPVLVSIILNRDREAREAAMRYSEVIMMLVSENQTSYRDNLRESRGPDRGNGRKSHGSNKAASDIDTQLLFEKMASLDIEQQSVMDMTSQRDGNEVYKDPYSDIPPLQRIEETQVEEFQKLQQKRVKKPKEYMDSPTLVRTEVDDMFSQKINRPNSWGREVSVDMMSGTQHHSTPLPTLHPPNEPTSQPGSLQVVPPRQPFMSLPSMKQPMDKQHSPRHMDSTAESKNINKEDTRPQISPPVTDASKIPKGSAANKQDGVLKISHTHKSGAKTKIEAKGIGHNIQVGDNNTMVVGGRPPKTKRKPDSQQRGSSDVKLTESVEPLNTEQKDMIASNIGKARKKLCRAMGLSDTEIEQIEHDFQVGGTYEQMYQAITKWGEQNGKSATVRSMAEFLVEVGRVDLAIQLK